ncbi:MAG: hypothetical protein ACTSW4_01170 [Candidatus Ranarchaeia archaeon]
MRIRNVILINLILVGLILSVNTTSVLAQGNSPGNNGRQPIFHSEANNFTVSIDNFTVRINTDTHPLFSFWREENPDERYLVHLTDLIEFNDSNQDGVAQPSERTPLGTLALASGTWEVSPIINETEDDLLKAVHFNYTLTGIDVPFFSGLNLQFRFHLYLENTTIVSNGIETFVAGGTELKFDIVIENWPWASADNKLALRLLFVTGQHQTLQHRHMVRNQTQNQAMVWENEANTTQAYFRYNNQVTLKNSTSMQNRNVTSGLESDLNNPVLYIVYPYFTGQLVHDPTLGIIETTTEESSPVPSIFDIITHPYFVGGLTLIVIIASMVVLRKTKAK